MTTRTWLVLAAAALTLSACGGTSTGSQTTVGPLSLLPSADVFTSAVVATRTMGTAREVIDVRTTTPTRRDTRHGDGPAVIASGWGDVTWTVGTDTYREMVNGRGLYVQSDPPDGQWELQPVGAPTVTSGYVHSLRNLGVLHDTTNEGPDRTAGVPTTRYTGWLPLDEREATLLGLTASDLAALPDDADQRRENVTAWVDDFGRIVRVDRVVSDGTTELIRASTSLSDFALLLDLTPPSNAGTRAQP